jgi:hypothetical protein
VDKAQDNAKVERNREKGQIYHIHQIRTVRAAQG